MSVRCVVLLFCFFGLFCPELLSQTLPQDPKAIAALDKARELSTLHQASAPSFHIKASFQTFDYKGMPDGDGNVEETAASSEAWKRTVVFRGKKSIEYSSQGKSRFVADEGFSGTFVEARILEKLFNPIPGQDTFAKESLAARKTKFGPNELTCVIAGLPYVTGNDSKASAPNAAYCVEDQTGLLRVIQGHNGLSFALNHIHRLGNAYVAFDITMSEHGIKRATLNVQELSAVPHVDVAELQTPEQATSGVDAITDVPHAIIAGRKISGGNPQYPKDAKDRRIQGNVVLRCIIGKDGTIRDMELVSAPDDSLVLPSMEAVRTWRYQPYLLDGKPCEVNTTITVNFAFSQ